MAAARWGESDGKLEGAVGLVKCASAYLFAFCGDITRQSFSEHN